MSKKSKTKKKVITGEIHRAKGGFGFLKSDAFDKDVFIARKHMKDAMDGDIAEVALIPCHFGKTDLRALS